MNTQCATAISTIGSQSMEFLSETLTDEELATITGYKTASFQRQWLASNHWEFVLTGAQRPVVGRVYARLKLAGVKPTANNAVTETWTLDLARVG
jgi:hypothetical protein